MQIISNNGGPTPAETWASLAADRVVDSSQLTGERQVAALKLKAKLAAALYAPMSAAQSSEREKLAASDDRLLEQPDLNSFIGVIQAAILSVTSKTEWSDHFASPKVLQAAWDVIAPLLATIIHIERLWHTDANATSPQAVAYRANRG